MDGLMWTTFNATLCTRLPLQRLNGFHVQKTKPIHRLTGTNCILLFSELKKGPKDVYSLSSLASQTESSVAWQSTPRIIDIFYTSKVASFQAEYQRRYVVFQWLLNWSTVWHYSWTCWAWNWLQQGHCTITIILKLFFWRLDSWIMLL